MSLQLLPGNLHFKGFVGVICVAALLLFCDAKIAAQTQILRGHVPAPVHKLQAIGRLKGDQRLDLAIGLSLRNKAGLTNLLQELYDPTSTNYHRFLSSDEFSQRFCPSEQDYQAVIDFAKSKGFTVTAEHPNRTLLDVNGSVGDIEKAFHFSLRLYRHPAEKRDFYAPDAEPSVELSVPLSSISGLEDFVLPRPLIKTVSFDKDLPPVSYSTGSGPRTFFIGNDFRAAYAPGVSLTGAGQSVGLFQLDGYYPSDIATYEALAGLPNVPLTNVLLNGFSGNPGINNDEVALDIDMAISMAPGLSQVIVYEGRTPNDVLNRMATDNLAKQLSSSWGFGAQIDAAREQIFMQFAAQGQSMFQASGDEGAWVQQVFPPSDDPFLTVVGGTLLTTGGSGQWVSETTWPESGGGISASNAIPIWQQGINMSTNHGSTSKRNVPDVAAVSDGIWIILNNGEQVVIGGTSAAAPLWAGFTALANQQAAASGNPSIGFLNPALYSIGKGSNYLSDFHDVTSGNNTNSISPTNFFAVSGYDLCTGWGTPIGTNLIAALMPPPDTLQISPATTVTASGPAGGPFAPASQFYSLTNLGSTPLNWTLVNTSSWLSVSSTGGALIAGGSGMNVTVSLNSSASNLTAGTYRATLTFSNLSLQTAQSREFDLVVLTNPTAPEVTLSTLYSFSGSSDGSSPNGLVLASNGVFFGTTKHGGTNAFGAIFQFDTNGNFVTRYSFTGSNDGANPFGALAQATDGSFYGTAFQGGGFDNGTVFRMLSDGTVTTLISLNITNGDLPYAGLTLGGDGKFYGTTYQGGSFGRGTVFKLSTNGALTTIYSFTGGNDGGFVYAGLASGIDGNLYGTTFKSGISNFGTIFRISTNGLLTTLVSFDRIRGAFPYSGLVQATDGNFYGATSSGGTSNAGTLFRVSPGGLFTNLYLFNGGNDGGGPASSLIQSSDGNLYGTTAYGGAYGVGTVFRLTPSGAVSTLVQFNGFNGANPKAALVEAADASLYGTTDNGGSNGVGTIFRLVTISPPQITTQPLSQTVFAGSNDTFSVAVVGSSPLSYQWRKDGTNLADIGNISGSTARTLTLTNVATTNTGNYSVLVSNSLGSATSSVATLTVNLSAPFITAQPTNQTLSPGATATFSVTAQGNLPLVYRWQRNGTNISDGANVAGSTTSTLTINSATETNNGTYAVVITNSLGSVTSSNAALVVIPVSAPGTRMATLFSFGAGANGLQPNGLVQASDGDLYGTTQSGGAYGDGTVFRLTTNGIFTRVVSFDGTNGGMPSSSLRPGTDGNLYGTTSFGGDSGVGIVFRMTTNGALTVLYSFTGEDDGGNPSASLIQGTDSNFYGMAEEGGSFGYGSIFKITPGGALSNLYAFSGGSDGGFPNAGLVQGKDGNFYGTTPGGGIHGDGNVFRLAPNGTFANLYSFSNDFDGSLPTGALVQGTDGTFYGTTRNNSRFGFQLNGTIFRITTNGALSILYMLNFMDGAHPTSGVIEGSDGNFYGTTYDGGLNNNSQGTIFSISPNGTITNLVNFDGFDDGAHPNAPLVEASDGSFYGTTTTGGPGNRGTIFRLTITNAPRITAQPADQIVSAGASASFSVAVFGARPLSYHWQRNGTNLSDSANLIGSSERVLSLGHITAADAGSFSVVVSNALGSVTSTGALLSVVSPPVFQAVAKTNGTIALMWSATVGQKYQLQFKPNLNSTNWTNLGNVIIATNFIATASDPIGSNFQRFYRVVLLP